jgi:hypothetical protein
MHALVIAIERLVEVSCSLSSCSNLPGRGIRASPGLFLRIRSRDPTSSAPVIAVTVGVVSYPTNREPSHAPRRVLSVGVRRGGVSRTDYRCHIEIQVSETIVTVSAWSTEVSWTKWTNGWSSEWSSGCALILHDKLGWVDQTWTSGPPGPPLGG